MEPASPPSPPGGDLSPSAGAPLRSPPRRRYLALRLLAVVLRWLALLHAVGVGIGVLFIFGERWDPAGGLGFYDLLVILGWILGGALSVLVLLASADLIDLLIDMESN